MNTQNIISINTDEKFCRSCGEIKAIASFSKGNYSGVLAEKCKECRVAISRKKNASYHSSMRDDPERYARHLEKKNESYHATREGMPDLRQNVVLTEGGRECLECGQPKLWSEFVKDVWGFNGKTSNCKSCRNIKARKVYQDNPELRRTTIKQRPDKLMRLYGVTYAEIVCVLDDQHGLCANRACGKEISLEEKGTTSNRAVIDHDHKTGKFRALLCSPCNLILGTLETKENIILGLMEYKTKHNHKFKE